MSFIKSPILYNHGFFFIFENNIYNFNLKTKKHSLIFLTKENCEISNLFFNNQNALCFLITQNNLSDIFILNLENNALTQLTFNCFSHIVIASFFENTIVFSTLDETYDIEKTYEINIHTKIISQFALNNVKFLQKHKKNFIWQKNGYGYLIWKNYQGGTAGKIYKNDKLLINSLNNCLKPQIVENRIFFIHDNGENGNIFSTNMSGNNLTQETFEKDFKITNFSSYKNQIIYEKLGYIFLFNTKNKTTEQIFIPNIQPKIQSENHDVKNFITNFDVIKNNLVVCAKGNVFFGNQTNGPVIKLNENLRFIQTKSINETIVALQEPPFSSFHFFNLNGEKVKTIEISAKKILNFLISSNEEFLIYFDINNNVYKLDLKTNEETTIFSMENTICNFLKISLCANNEFLLITIAQDSVSFVHLLNINTKESQIINHNFAFVFEAIFDKFNKFILLICANFSLYNDSLKFNYAFLNEKQIFAISLTETPINCNWLQNYDQTEIVKLSEIDLTNLENKIEKLPFELNNYSNIVQLENHVFLTETNLELTKLNLKTLKTELFTKDFSNYFLSSDSTTIVVEKEKKFYISSLEKFSKENCFEKNRIYQKNEISQELHNKFNEICFLIENLFWDKNLNNINWQEIKEKYQKEIVRFNNHEDFNLLLNLIQGELKTSHAFIYSRQKPKHKLAFLGAEIKFDELSQNYTINKVYDSNIVKSIFSPLKPYNISTNANILKINNINITKENFKKELLNLNNQYIQLTIQENNETKNLTIKTISKNENQHLIYQTFVNNNRKIVQSINEEIGYIHCQNMQTEGYQNFFEQFFKEFSKKAIILDFRYNVGGNISHLIFDYISRTCFGFEMRRGAKKAMPYETTNNKFVLLINEYSSSDAEIFAAYFKINKIGKVVGTRTWGGIVGISPRFEFVDKTISSQPEFNSFFHNENFNNIENYGVVPDIIVENSNKANAIDSQLMKAIEMAQKLI